jgi:hypothetical protein
VTRTGEQSKFQFEVTNLRLILVAVSFVAFGVVLLFASGNPDLGQQWSALTSQLGGLMVATGLLALAWEWFGKRAFADEIYAKVQLSVAVLRTGLVKIGPNFNLDVDWADLFDNARELDIYVGWGRTWRTQQRTRIQELASRGGRIRVFLPDPDDPQTLANLAYRFGMTPDEVVHNITGAIKDFRSMGSTIEVRVRKGPPLFTFYCFGSRAVFAPYSHAGERRMPVPALVVRGGQFMDFIEQEISLVHEQSTPAPAMDET